MYVVSRRGFSRCHGRRGGGRGNKRSGSAGSGCHRFDMRGVICTAQDRFESCKSSAKAASWGVRRGWMTVDDCAMIA